jgi:hypothetical protein
MGVPTSNSTVAMVEIGVLRCVTGREVPEGHEQKAPHPHAELFVGQFRAKKHVGGQPLFSPQASSARLYS